MSDVQPEVAAPVAEQSSAPAVPLPAPAPEQAPADAQTVPAPAPVEPPTPAEPTDGKVTLSRSDLMDLVEELASRRAAAPLPTAQTRKVRIDPSAAKSVGDYVLHNGRVAQIVDVIEAARDENGEAWTQVLYRVAVATEDRLMEAEDAGEV